MYKLSRFMLIVNVLLWLYCFVLLIGLFWPFSYIAVIALMLYFGGKKAYQKLSSYGTARWADRDDMKGMIDATSGPVIGVVDAPKRAVKPLLNPKVKAKEACHRFLGRKKQSVVRLPNAVNLAVFAPVGAGKSTGMVIPFLRVCEESCIVIDFKGELALETALHRQKMGHEIVILDPYHMVTQ